tara:strand:+ start:577 stop:882 length:306 start_codon:yes stop_codon:yes gene_type:complete
MNTFTFTDDELMGLIQNNEVNRISNDLMRSITEKKETIIKEALSNYLKEYSLQDLEGRIRCDIYEKVREVYFLDNKPILEIFNETNGLSTSSAYGFDYRLL